MKRVTLRAIALSVAASSAALLAVRQPYRLESVALARAVLRMWRPADRRPTRLSPGARRVLRPSSCWSIRQVPAGKWCACHRRRRRDCRAPDRSLRPGHRAMCRPPCGFTCSPSSSAASRRAPPLSPSTRTTSSTVTNHALAPTDTTSRGNHDRHPTPADDNRCRYPGLQ